MKKIVLTLAAIAFAVSLVFSPVTHASPKPPQAPAIECQTTVWHDSADTTTHTYGDGTNYRVHLDSLRDSVNNAYCGKIRTQLTWNMPSGICHIFVTYIDHGTTQIAYGQSTNQCGNVGSVFSANAVATDGWNVDGWGTLNGIPSSLIGVNWTIN